MCYICWTSLPLFLFLGLGGGVHFYIVVHLKSMLCKTCNACMLLGLLASLACIVFMVQRDKIYTMRVLGQSKKRSNN